MITYRSGDLFTSSCRVLVDPVNCVGVAGAGLAKQFKERFPTLDKKYVQLCKQGFLRPGRPYLWQAKGSPDVLLFPTKDHWKQPSRLRWIEEGLAYMLQHQRAHLPSVAFPKLGAGLGGLAWEEVRAVLERHLGDVDVPVEVYL